MEIARKLEILSDAAKYDVACTSSGVDRAAEKGKMGNAVSCGICHSFAADGRCISLLKVLMSNACVYDCAYCANRRSNDRARATFSPRELAELTVAFYRRNYIEGLFLSSGVLRNPDHTMEQMCLCLDILRGEYGFRGYVHAKTIPGSSPELIHRLGLLADRLSVNLELPSEESLRLLAPDKPRGNILGPMARIRDGIVQNRTELVRYSHAPAFAPAGSSTQMIIGATPDSDLQIVRLAESLYKKYTLKRVFYSAYIPVGVSALLPVNQPVPLLREHRLYQADWLLRFYGFSASELLDESSPHLDPLLDPKEQWALRHLESFPVEVNTADRELLLRVPGIGVTGAERILRARRSQRLDFDTLKKLRVVLKRAQYFITCKGRMLPGVRFEQEGIYRSLTYDARRSRGLLMEPEVTQLSLFGGGLSGIEEVRKCLTGQL
ncbi:MAG: putative DNA modification/repair radical SAM protein [Oscillospiraceae bacterium]|jgi:putative DNA modification/repair radical SAM protein|nr:putative DNA modification/repair radical SAM protein [Oscillospiraceae bacterium]